MKAFVSTIILVIIINIGLGQNLDSARQHQLTHEILSIIEKNSIVSDSINWVEFRKEMDFLASSNPNDSGNRIVLRIFNELKKYGDYHSHWISRKRNVQKSSLSNIIEFPKIELLDNSIGYIKIPSYGIANDLSTYLYLDSAIKQIQRLDQSHSVVGWIVDLQGNSGGNMFPMIGCVLPLFTEDSLGYFINKNGKRSWLPTFYNPDIAINKVVKYKCKTLNQKIAVLIDPKTASAAELTAISLVGLPFVKTFGDSSRGMTTANRKIKLSTGAAIALAVSYAQDRNGKIYQGKIIPDVFVKKEDIIKIAKDWVNKK